MCFDLVKNKRFNLYYNSDNPKKIMKKNQPNRVNFNNKRGSTK